MTEAEKRRIKKEIDALRRRDPEAVRRFEAIPVHPSFIERKKAIEESERITAADLAIVINAR